MNCKDFQPDLKAYIDNELSQNRRAQILAHVDNCKSCAQDIENMEEINRTIKQSEYIEPLSDHVRDAILTRAFANSNIETQQPKNRFWPFSLPTQKVIGLFAAVACCMVVVGVGLSHFGSHSYTNDSLSRQSSQFALSTAQYTQDYDEKFSAQAPPELSASSSVVRPDTKVVASTNSIQASDRPDIESDSAKAPSATVSFASPQQIPDLPSPERQVHHDASITIQTKDPESASDSVESLVKSVGGYVASNDLSSDAAGNKTAQIYVKVPVMQFDSILGQLEKLGVVQEKHITGQDLTTKISDAGETESVLESDVSQSAQHLKDLGRHATWEDEENDRQLRIELAQSRERVKILGKLAELSDISISIVQTPNLTPPVHTGMLNNLHTNAVAAYQSAVGSLSIVLSILIWILAYSPIWGTILLITVFVRRRFCTIR